MAGSQEGPLSWASDGLAEGCLRHSAHIIHINWHHLIAQSAQKQLAEWVKAHTEANEIT